LEDSISGMRITGITLLLLVLAIATGCGTRKNTATPPPSFSAVPGLTPGSADTNGRGPVAITPERGLEGKVINVETSARFVIVGFRGGRLPAQGQRFNVYRQGLKVGQIRINGPQRDQNAVADLMDGEAQPGDDVRED
jgi:hypothetical protein